MVAWGKSEKIIKADSLFRDGEKRCMLLTMRCKRDMYCTNTIDKCTACVMPTLTKECVDQVLDTIGACGCPVPPRKD